MKNEILEDNRPYLNYAIITSPDHHDQSYDLIKIDTYNSSEELNKSKLTLNGKVLIFMNSISEEDFKELPNTFKSIHFINKTFDYESEFFTKIPKDLIAKANNIFSIGDLSYGAYGKEDYLIYKLLTVPYTTWLNKNDPLPFTTIFFNSKTFEILDQEVNTLSLGSKRSDRYLHHAEKIISDSFPNKSGLQTKNLHAYTTYMPCHMCFQHLSAINEDNEEYRLHKVLYLLEEKKEETIQRYNSLRRKKSKLHFDKIELESTFQKNIFARCSKYINLATELIRNSNNNV